MKMPSSDKSAARIFCLLALPLSAFLFAGCATTPGMSEVAPQSEQSPSATVTDAEPNSETDEGTGLQQVVGRGVSADDTALVLRTADGEKTFQIRAEDLQAVDPEHFNSHVGVDSLGYRIYFISEGGVDYAVSVEEVDGSELGFD
jgi:hypothetical protein